MLVAQAKQRLNSNRTYRASQAFSSVPKLIFLGLILFGIEACSWRPIEALTSLSPAVGAGTLGYNDAVGDAADRILLTNILRARDREPLNLSQLSSVSGTISLSGTAGFTLPFGPAGSMGSNKVLGQDSAMPSVTGTTTPTYTVTPLNTQAFTLSILQPVSSAYILNRWQAGVSRELLLLLFVKEIDFPETAGDTSGPSRYINDPDNKAGFLAFSSLVHSIIVTNNAELKAFDVLDPIGPSFTLRASDTASDTKVGDTSTLADQTGFGLITNANDGQYHVGNIIAKGGPKADQPISKGGQLYRVYAGQVALCVSGKILTAQPPEINPPTQAPAAPAPTTNKPSQAVGMLLRQSALSEALLAPAPGSSSMNGSATKGAAGTSPSTGGGASTQAMTAALQAGRVSAIVSADGCISDEIVLNPSDEGTFQNTSQSFIHIQWRSVSEVFEYLGAILRYNERHPQSPEPSTEPSSCSTTPSTTGSSTPTPSTPPLAALPENLSSPFQFPACGDPSVVKIHAFETEPQPPSILFAVYQGIIGDLSVRHNGNLYEIADNNAKSPNTDYTRTILSMLGTLVNYSAQPSVSTTTPLRLLPIP